MFLNWLGVLVGILLASKEIAAQGQTVASSETSAFITTLNQGDASTDLSSTAGMTPSESSPSKTTSNATNETGETNTSFTGSKETSESTTSSTATMATTKITVTGSTINTSTSVGNKSRTKNEDTQNSTSATSNTTKNSAKDPTSTVTTTAPKRMTETTTSSLETSPSSTTTLTTATTLPTTSPPQNTTTAVTPTASKATEVANRVATSTTEVGITATTTPNSSPPQTTTTTDLTTLTSGSTTTTTTTHYQTTTTSRVTTPSSKESTMSPATASQEKTGAVTNATTIEPGTVRTATLSTKVTTVTSEAPTTTVTESATNKTTGVDTVDHDLIIGVAAGSAGGVVAVLIVIFLIIWLVTRRRRRRRNPGSQMNGRSHLANPNVESTLNAKQPLSTTPKGYTKEQKISKEDGHFGFTPKGVIRNSGRFHETSLLKASDGDGKGKGAKKRRNSDVSLGAFFFSGITASEIKSDKGSVQKEDTLSVAHPNVAYIQESGSSTKPTSDSKSVQDTEELYSNRFIEENKKKAKDKMKTSASEQPKANPPVSKSDVSNAQISDDPFALGDWFANTSMYGDHESQHKPQARVQPRFVSQGQRDGLLETTNRPRDHHRKTQTNDNQMEPSSVVRKNHDNKSRNSHGYLDERSDVHRDKTHPRNITDNERYTGNNRISNDILHNKSRADNERSRRDSLGSGNSGFYGRNNHGEFARRDSHGAHPYGGGNRAGYSQFNGGRFVPDGRDQLPQYSQSRPGYASNPDESYERSRRRRPSTDTHGNYFQVYRPIAGSHGDTRARGNHARPENQYSDIHHVKREGRYHEDYNSRGPQDQRVHRHHRDGGRDFTSNEPSHLPMGTNYHGDFSRGAHPSESRLADGNRGRHDPSAHAYSHGISGVGNGNYHRHQLQPNFSPRRGEGPFDNRYINPYNW